jgi:hypothetical protein
MSRPGARPRGRSSDHQELVSRAVEEANLSTRGRQRVRISALAGEEPRAGFLARLPAHERRGFHSGGDQ